MSNRFKIGDKVVQIEASEFSEHNYPNQILTVHCMSGKLGSVFFTVDPKRGNMSHRFKLYTKKGWVDSVPEFLL